MFWLLGGHIIELDVEVFGGEKMYRKIVRRAHEERKQDLIVWMYNAGVEISDRSAEKILIYYEKEGLLF